MTTYRRDPLSTKRPPRMSPEQVRRQMLATAVEMVEERGLTVSLQHISLDAIVAMAGVARSAVYRVWPNRDEFFDELVLELARNPHAAPSVFDEATLVAVLDEIELKRSKDASYLANAKNRRLAVIEVCRVGSEVNYNSVLQRQWWRTYMALSATMLSYEEPMRGKLEKAISENEETYNRGMANFYEIMGDVLGRRVRPQFSSAALGRPAASYMAATGSALMEGMVLRHNILSQDGLLPDLGAQTLDCDPFDTGIKADWSAPSISFTGMFLAMTEPVPDEEYEAIPIETRIAEVRDLVETLKKNANNR